MIDDYGYAPDETPDGGSETPGTAYGGRASDAFTRLRKGVWEWSSAALGWLDRQLLGPRCPLCGDRYAGPRTLYRHLDREHAGDDLR
jgi:hypothetical protein